MIVGACTGRLKVLINCTKLLRGKLQFKPSEIVKISRNCSNYTMETDNIEKQNDFQEVKEGKAEVLFPKSVFYNPVQEFNRDLTVAVISQYSREKWEKRFKKNGKGDRKTGDEEDKQMDASNPEDDSANLANFDNLKAGIVVEDGLRILEGLSASGLRSVRFGLEIPGVKEIVANDFDTGAVEFIEKNIQKNNLTGLVNSNYGDAAMVMYQNKHPNDRFDVIDLDPYGSPSQFLDAAVQAVKDDGLLCITCTDSAVLCGVAGETCYSKYGAMSLRAKYCHEMALRIVLQCIESHANRYSRYTVPLISISADFYVRVFVKVYTGQGKVKRSVSKMAMVYNCVGCGAYSLQRLGNAILTKGDNFKYTPATGPPIREKCEVCNAKHQFGGPIWAESMYNVDFINGVIKYIEGNPGLFNTSDRIVGMLTMMTEELQDVPLYYIVDELCSVLHCIAMPSIKFRSAVLNAGYRVSFSHAAKNSLKTDAPVVLIWDILRTWIKENPIKEDRIVSGSVIEKIISTEIKTEVSFDIHPDANPKSREKKLLRWQPNPERDWGPKARAKRSGAANNESLAQKKLDNQGRRKNKNKDKGGEGVNVSQHPCQYFKIGNCTKGDDCGYSHDIDMNEQVTIEHDNLQKSAESEK